MRWAEIPKRLWSAPSLRQLTTINRHYQLYDMQIRPKRSRINQLSMRVKCKNLSSNWKLKMKDWEYCFKIKESNSKSIALLRKRKAMDRWTCRLMKKRLKRVCWPIWMPWTCSWPIRWNRENRSNRTLKRT